MSFEIRSTSMRGMQILGERIKAGEYFVKVGVPDNAKDENDGVTMVKKAIWNEFGTRNKDGSVRIPERPAFRIAMRTGRERFVRLNKINLFKILHGQATMGVALGQLGAMGAGEVKRVIRASEGIEPNAPYTIAKKGSSKPLIDKGQLIQSITWQVPGEFVT
jgi:hypothetical protein